MQILVESWKKSKKKSTYWGFDMQDLYCWKISIFISCYFKSHLRTKINRISMHNDDGEVLLSGNLSVFSHLGWPVPKILWGKGIWQK